MTEHIPSPTEGGQPQRKFAVPEREVDYEAIDNLKGTYKVLLHSLDTLDAQIAETLPGPEFDRMQKDRVVLNGRIERHEKEMREHKLNPHDYIIRH